jgi:hypothetical protein
MRGLTVEETAWYQKYQTKRSQRRDNPDQFPWKSVDEMSEERERWRALYQKHETAPLAAIVAEAELREKPTTN